MYKFLEHVSDQLVEVEAKDVEELFEDSAKAFFDTLVDINKVEPKDEFEIELTANNIQDLLYRFLNELLYLFDTKKAVFSKFEAEFDEENMRIDVRMWGEYFDPKKHEPRYEIKAVTLHNFEVKHNGCWKARFLFDL